MKKEEIVNLSGNNNENEELKKEVEEIKQKEAITADELLKILRYEGIVSQFENKVSLNNKDFFTFMKKIEPTPVIKFKKMEHVIDFIIENELWDEISQKDETFKTLDFDKIKEISKEIKITENLLDSDMNPYGKPQVYKSMLEKKEELDKYIQPIKNYFTKNLENGIYSISLQKDKNGKLDMYAIGDFSKNYLIDTEQEDMIEINGIDIYVKTYQKAMANVMIPIEKVKKILPNMKIMIPSWGTEEHGQVMKNGSFITLGTIQNGVIVLKEILDEKTKKVIGYEVDSYGLNPDKNNIQNGIALPTGYYPSDINGNIIKEKELESNIEIK